MKRIIPFIFCFSIFSTFASAQKENSTSDFEFLVNKIHNDYPGFKDKITPPKDIELKALEHKIRVVITKSPDSSFYYFRKYTEFFKDFHLRIGRVSPNSSKLEKAQVSSYGENFAFDSITLKTLSLSTGSIEGIWTSNRGDIAIKRSLKNDSFLGIATNFSNWDSGQVMFEFVQKNDTLFEIVKHSNFNNIRPRKGIASLYVNNYFLEIYDQTFFVRKSNSRNYDLASIKTYIPNHPNGTNTFFVTAILSDSTFYIRVPSFSGMKQTIESALKKYKPEILKRPNMIIDIRNNGGGQDDEYQMLSKIIYTNPYESKGVEWYATKGNIKIFEDALKAGEIRNGQEGIIWTEALVKEMKENIGKFVVHPFNRSDNDITITEDTIYSNPRRIGIIINENNGSSAEQFLLESKNSKKVTLFGNKPTAGVLDYSNAISVDFPSGNYDLTIPMTRSTRLPENPIDNIGIKPDIIIPFPETTQLFDKLDSWTEFVKNYFEIQTTNKN
jgi:hypothetical protein